MAAAIVYTDLDGTMVGPRGSFVHTADGGLTAEPWTALLELHRAGVPLVLVSGRTHAQLQEAGRVFAVDGWVAELGSTVSWAGGRESHLLTGELPGEFAGRAPVEVMAELGVVDALVAAWPGRVEWHAPWSATHTGDAMLRGRLDTAEVDAWLADRGWGWLTLKDNGRVPRTPRVTLAVEGDPHVYHLMPRGIGKGLAITWDLQRRGLDPADAVAVGTPSATWRWPRPSGGCSSPPTAPPSPGWPRRSRRCRTRRRPRARWAWAGPRRCGRPSRR